VKELGIRKVLGASVAQLTTLLSREFVVLVLLSMLVAVPVVYMAMSKLLQFFAYRISLHWTIFFFTCAAAITLALLTVGFQTVRAARLNPVKNLRTE
jgi:putative ABC transport system permease protein